MTDPSTPAPHPRALHLRASPVSPMVGSTLTVVAQFTAAALGHEQERVKARIRAPGAVNWSPLVTVGAGAGVYSAAYATREPGEHTVEFIGESDTKIIERIAVVIRPG